MIDMSATTEARALVERREQEAREQQIASEAAAIEHRRAMAVTGQNMIDGQQRNRAARVAAHAASVSTARAAKDHFTKLSEQREKVESRLGFRRADHVEAVKRRSKCLPPDPNDYPTQAERDAYEQRCAEHDREIHRLQALIGTETAEYDRAKFIEWEAQAALDQAAGEELRLRNEL